MYHIKLLPQFRDLDRQLAVLAGREQWSRAEVEALQLERLNTLWQQARTNVAYYEALAASRRLPPKFQSLAEFTALVPRLTKAEIRVNQQRLLSRQRVAGHWNMTGGSTGEPTRVFWSTEGVRESLRGKYRFCQQWDIDPLARVAFLWGHASALRIGPMGWWRALKQRAVDRLRNRVRFSAYRTTPADLQRYLQTMAKFGPQWLYGYSSAVYLLAREAEEMNFQCPALEAVVMTSEPILPAYRAAVRRGLNAMAIGEYGTIDCGFIGGETPVGGYQVREDNVFFETVPNALGTYDIVVTPLTNPAFPLIRYELGDTTDKPLSRPERGFGTVPQILGRSNDLLVSASGVVLHWVVFMDTVEQVVPSFGRFAVHQRADRSLRLEFEAQACPARARWQEDLRRLLDDLTEGLPLEISIVEHLTLTRAGKRRFITSDVDLASIAPARSEPAAAAIGRTGR